MFFAMFAAFSGAWAQTTSQTIYLTEGNNNPVSFGDNIAQATITDCIATNGTGIYNATNASPDLNSGVKSISISYYECSWNAATKQVERTVVTVDNNIKNICDPEFADGGVLYGNNYTYIANGTATIPNGFTVKGDCKLVLCDGAQVTVNGDGIEVEEDATLRIYAQSEGTSSGRLISSTGSYAGIGSKGGFMTVTQPGTIEIHGGYVEARGGSQSAGIGGGENAKGAVVTIYGGTVKAYGSTNAAGIGSGNGSHYGGALTIYGGDVYASGGEWAAGIGTGISKIQDDTYTGSVIIHGGTVEAVGGSLGAGIGGGDYQHGLTVTINGGNVTAIGGGNGAGIGGGRRGKGGTVNINGGTVIAYGGEQHGAGIGGGQAGNGATVTITGGDVYAHGGQDAAGIGSGEEFLSSNHGGSLTVTGGHVFAKGSEWAAGIGGGEDADGADVKIYGGIVEAWAGTKAGPDGGLAIGGGDHNEGYGTLEIGDNMMVHAGDYPEDADEHLFVTGQRKSACWYRTYARIEPCDHQGGTYSEGDHAVGVSCTHCNTTSMPFTFQSDGQWDNAANWFQGFMPNTGDDVAVKANVSIPHDCIAHVGDITIEDGGTITIADGGQLIHNNENVQATVEKDIEAYNSDNDGWNFIASPISVAITPVPQNGFLIDTYDLYYLEEETTIWRNFKQSDDSAHPDFAIEPRKGYLYANSEGTTLQFAGSLQPYVEHGIAIPLTHDGDGWNLVGNPFAFAAYASKPYYVINGRNVEPSVGGEALAPCTGIVVKAEDEGADFVTFTKDAPQQNAHQGNLNITVAEANVTRGAATLDKAIVSFNEGTVLPKFRFGDNAEVYIPQGGEDYAIASVGGRDGACTVSTNEMPLNFKATKDGEYTISVTPENVDVDYLHLIDNMTGADVDLLAANVRDSRPCVSTYTFTAKLTDYASRCRLVFHNDDEPIAVSYEPFAYYDGSEWVITEDTDGATLQVIDMMGRVIINRDATNRVSTNGMAHGVYVMRLISGKHMSVQKVVVIE